MKQFSDLVAEALTRVPEIMPWDLVKEIAANGDLILLDVREPEEFKSLHIAGSVNIPRGVLESSCDFGYENTHEEIANSREREIVVICRSGKRSVLAADVMQQMGFKKVVSLKLGVRGWNDFEQRLIDEAGRPVDADMADTLLAPLAKAVQRR